ncbi:hypothetical protein [Geodermatophilus poikilotrophus]|uniref:Uncharacterized protein n=1 Tax=Geodermatophilus poikilotrophus TaxID=1333667 RepID=A0A1I0IQD7_9ACTN|nr:hypothetical protein [Geodermatophilus poikilotrophus]SET98682.1 hypothetical protein SAMN04488546_4557 [Geodermatophilus poikilotrophus]
MDSRPSSRHPRRLLLRAALVAVVAVVALVAVPGAASARGTVVPLLDCVVANDDGSWTAVFGYRNTSSSPVRIPTGPRNKVTPATVGSPQPTTFQPGTHRGAFTVTVARGAGPMWHLDGTNLAARRGTATACPSSTQMPADGNGTGAAIALVAAGLVGTVAVQRARRRAPAGRGDR